MSFLSIYFALNSRTFGGERWLDWCYWGGSVSLSWGLRELKISICRNSSNRREETSSTCDPMQVDQEQSQFLACRGWTTKQGNTASLMGAGLWPSNPLVPPTQPASMSSPSLLPLVGLGTSAWGLGSEWPLGTLSPEPTELLGRCLYRRVGGKVPRWMLWCQSRPLCTTPWRGPRQLPGPQRTGSKPSSRRASQPTGNYYRR